MFLSGARALQVRFFLIAYTEKRPPLSSTLALFSTSAMCTHSSGNFALQNVRAHRCGLRQNASATHTRKSLERKNLLSVSCCCRVQEERVSYIMIKRGEKLTHCCWYGAKRRSVLLILHAPLNPSVYFSRFALLYERRCASLHANGEKRRCDIHFSCQIHSGKLEFCSK